MILSRERAFPGGNQLLLKRTYAAPIHRVFQAWIDVHDLTRWFTPNLDEPARVSELDVRQGGGFIAAFGRYDEPPWVERVQYIEIDPPHRLLMLGHMTREGVHVCIARYEVTFIERDGATAMTLLETGAPPENLEDRAGGWGGTLDNLATVLG
jgi:uncharacterized protein YndB with AHSA1/START domain